uniref:Uncharacterized protein n=1 Tax=Chromera velia CCMP2878 TaxID=1169474 RepID=A0A0G4HEY4_9ALVE|mmetsp:Transcript_36051/g.70957  ORF Transcript_36051/g.70957 Transcript_36051/m.70957 type:complete len:678 (+) Transcript_36051:201-2234(+)|eukprot:Cvel_26926.t1-p1 / transcript=Cvel_26926.t1 / gene=Cvel_26926 / organism=Chromera_velia_CCMP2878 / gene_product=hypothetical protein / transcript_product=hypothetical protein / location=Cvel_scaffold3277:6936-10956(+) / protein_length=677 / sequence_SO=supercontig / SO=protein_coding / is_pseudo=false
MAALEDEKNHQTNGISNLVFLPLLGPGVGLPFRCINKDCNFRAQEFFHPCCLSGVENIVESEAILRWALGASLGRDGLPEKEVKEDLEVLPPSDRLHYYATKKGKQSLVCSVFTPDIFPGYQIPKESVRPLPSTVEVQKSMNLLGAVRGAALGGRTDVLSSLIDQCTDRLGEARTEDLALELARHAMENNQIETVRWLLETGREVGGLTEGDVDVLVPKINTETAGFISCSGLLAPELGLYPLSLAVEAERGKWENVRRYLELSGVRADMTSNSSSSSSSSKGRGGETTALDVLAGHMTVAVEWAAKGGHVKMLDRLLVWSKVEIKKRGGALDQILRRILFNKETMNGAAKRGHISVLEWLRSNWVPWNDATLGNAAFSNQWDVVRWLYAQHPKCPLSRDWMWGVTYVAAIKGNLKELKWLREECSPPIEMNDYAFYAAVHSGSAEVALYIAQSEKGVKADASHLQVALKRGRWEIVKTLLHIHALQGCKSDGIKLPSCIFKASRLPRDEDIRTTILACKEGDSVEANGKPSSNGCSSRSSSSCSSGGSKAEGGDDVSDPWVYPSYRERYYEACHVLESEETLKGLLDELLAEKSTRWAKIKFHTTFRRWKKEYDQMVDTAVEFGNWIQLRDIFGPGRSRAPPQSWLSRLGTLVHEGGEERLRQFLCFLNRNTIAKG